MGVHKMCGFTWSCTCIKSHLGICFPLNCSIVLDDGCPSEYSSTIYIKFPFPSFGSSIRQPLPWVSCEGNSSYSFVLMVLKLCMCFHDMSICMWFGYNC